MHRGPEAALCHQGRAPNPDLAHLAARRARPFLQLADATAFLAPLPLAELEPDPTLEMIIAAMEMRRTGRARKPMITVPTQLLGQWHQAILEAYPHAKILAFESEDLLAQKREKAMARIAYGDWDIVLVPHSSFELMSASHEKAIKVLQTWLDEVLEAEAKTREEEGNAHPNVKKLAAAGSSRADRPAPRRSRRTRTRTSRGGTRRRCLVRGRGAPVQNLFFFRTSTTCAA
jgi:hypothetical protein